MWLGFPSGDELLADADGEGQIDEVVSVDMAQFAATDAQLDAAEAMAMGGDARPRADFRDDLVAEWAGVFYQHADTELDEAQRGWHRASEYWREVPAPEPQPARQAT